MSKSGALSDLDWWMNERRLELGLDWQDLAAAIPMSRQALLDIRKGGAMRPKTERRLEAVLRWKRGSIFSARTGGQPTNLDNGHDGGGPELRDEFERTIWGMDHLTEDEKWIHIDLHRARVQRRNESGRSQTG